MSASTTVNGRTGRSSERRIADVPIVVRLMLAAALALQLGWHAWRPDPRADLRPLGPVPAQSALPVAALGEPAVLAKLLMLRLLAHDGQPGVRVAFMDLDYERVARWLDAIVDLDPRADAPLLAAARLYGSVPDPGRQRRMFELVCRRFLEDPDRRWPWLAHAAVIAKHRLEDPGLALRYARAVSRHATGPDVPAWVRDMSALIAADTGSVRRAPGADAAGPAGRHAVASGSNSGRRSWRYDPLAARGTARHESGSPALHAAHPGRTGSCHADNTASPSSRSRSCW